MRPRSAVPRLAARAVALAAAGAVVAALLPPAPAEAVSGERTATIPVWPGVVRERWVLAGDDGRRIEAQVVRVAPAADVALTTELAQGAVPGLEATDAMGRSQLGSRAVAGINGGFWRADPPGQPDGFFASEGRLVSEAETQASREVGRGAFGVTAGGGMAVDRILPQGLDLRADDVDLPVAGINRLDRGGPYPDTDDAQYLITDDFAPTVTVPPDEERSGPLVRAVDDVAFAPRGQGEPGVLGAASRAEPGDTLSVPDGGGLLLTYGDTRGDTEAVADGTTLRPFSDFRTSARAPGTRWDDVVEGLAGGPHIVRGGRMTPAEGWEAEGFSPGGHSLGKQPRTAVGVTDGGTRLLVTVDGRDEPRTVGMTIPELARFMIGLGAVEVVSLDGGGSTTMVQDNRVVNRPSDGGTRLVANGVFLSHDAVLARTERLAGSGREATAARVARTGFTEGTDTVVVASAGDFPDALAGGPLAAAADAPLLLASSRGLSDETLDAVDELGASRAVLLGGTAAVPDEAADQLRDAGLAVERVRGGTRFETAAAIGERLAEPGGRVLLASGQGFADALVAAAPAGMLGEPILLAAHDQLTGATRDALAELAPSEVVVVGGTGAVSSEVADAVRDAAPDAEVRRLAGASRYGTARALNGWAVDVLGDALDPTGVLVARGDTFPDALAGGPLGAERDQLLTIVPAWDVDADADSAAALADRRDAGLQEATLLGGVAVLSTYQEWQLDRLAGAGS